MAYQFYWHPFGFTCPHCNEVLTFRMFSIHQNPEITIYLFCPDCTYAEGPEVGKHVSFEQVLTFEYLQQCAKELDDKDKRNKLAVDEFAGFEQQMYEHLNPKLLPPDKGEGDETD